MKNFKEYLSEETMPRSLTDKEFIGIENESVRDNINSLLNGVTAKAVVTPYVSLERVRKVLAYYHIYLPAHQFMQGDSGNKVFNISQFGEKFGMNNNGEVVTKSDSPYYLYFEYQMNDAGMYDVYCEIVDSDELDEIMSDVEAEDEDDSEVVSTDQQNSYLINKDKLQEENINEVSKERLKKYVRDAKTDRDLAISDREHYKKNLTDPDRAWTKGIPHKDSQYKMAVDRNARAMKRSKGIARAEKKLASEDYDPNYADLARHAKKFYDSTSKVLASNARKIYKKHNKKATTGMDEETINEKATASKKAEKGTKWKLISRHPDSEGSEMELRQGKRKKMTGYYDRNASMFTMSKTKKGKFDPKSKQKDYDDAKDILKNVKEEAINEVSQKAATSAYASANDPDSYHPKADKILGHIKRKFGSKAASGAEDHAYASHFGRGTPHPGKDSLSGGLRQYASDKVTKSGKIPKGTQTAMKNRMDRSKWQGYGRKVGGPKGHLPEETINELSKGTLGSYITKASHDVATKSAAVGRYAERSRNDQSKSDYMSAKKHDDVSNKMFKKSWKRRQGIAKATDKLTREETINEISGKLARKAEHKAADRYHDAYDAETDARKAVIKTRTPEARDKAAEAKEKRTKAAKRVIRFQQYADKKSVKEEKKNDVPFDNPTEKPSTPYKNPASKAKQLARAAMKKALADKKK